MAYPLRSLLRLILSQLDLTYVVRDQVLKITTPEEAENELINRVYAVADLAPELRPPLVVGLPSERYDANRGSDYVDRQTGQLG